MKQKVKFKALNPTQIAQGSMILPPFLLHVLIVGVPVIGTLYAALTEWDGLGTKKFVGLQNFYDILHDPLVKLAFSHNIIWLLFFLIIPIMFGLIVGYVLFITNKGQKIYRTLIFVPYILSSAISSKIFSTLMNPYFGIGQLFDKIGLHALADINILGSQKLALFGAAFTGAWHWWPFVMVLFLAALQQVDPSLYEAAEIDGANQVQKFIHVTIPSVKQTLLFIVMLTMIGGFLTFDYVWIMTQGGPANSSEILSTLLYKNAFVLYKAGYATAIGVVQSFLAISAMLILRLTTRERS